MWLMRKNRNHLGLEEKPERTPPGAAATVRAEYKHNLAAWLERKDTCVSSIYEAVQKVPEALEVVELYNLEKEILPGNAINKEVLAKELLDRLVLRFRGEIQDELGDLNKKITHFIIQPDQKVCKGMYCLNGIIESYCSALLEEETAPANRTVEEGWKERRPSETTQGVKEQVP